MTDLSKIFKTTVKAIKLNSNINVDLNEELGLKSSKNKDKNLNQIFSVSKEAQNLVKNLTTLKAGLIKNKSNYVQPNYLIDNHVQTTENERELFEKEAEGIIRKCSETLKLLNQKAFSQNLTPQNKDHLNNLFYLLDKYLKDVCRIYTEQKAIQVRRTIEKKNFAQLYTPQVSLEKKNFKITNDYDPILHEQTSERENGSFVSLSADEAQVFEQENEYLIEQLTTSSQEIRHIQSQVIEIARLQEIFVEKILDQDSTINTIQAQSVNTNENIVKGNESIQEAMKNNAALRIWILFIVIVLSFTLLFLDWYNE